MGIQLLKNISYAAWHLRLLWLLGGFKALRAYRHCYLAQVPSSPIEIKMRRVPFPLLCRPGTTDAQTFWDTFGMRYHLPPKPLPSDAIILDLGANVGYAAFDLAVQYPGARIIAVELDEGNAALARANLKHFGERCAVIRSAVWCRDGEVVYGGKKADAFKVLSEEPGAEAALKAPAMTLDTLLEKHKLAHVDFVKMDIEGAEAHVLQAGAQWLTKVAAIKAEVHPPATVESVTSALRTAGFTVVRDMRHFAAVFAER